MVTENSTLYLAFGIGIEDFPGSMINIAESAREILEGSDLDFEEEFFKASVKIALDSGKGHSYTVREE